MSLPSLLLPDIEALHLDTDLDFAAAALSRTGRVEPGFVLAANRFLKLKAEDRAARRGIRNFIKPENAAAVLCHLPAGDGDRTHCVLRGDFVLCDLIPAIIADRGACPHLRIATLGMSVANADTLACLVERGSVGSLTLIVSHYFAQVDRATVFRAAAARLANVAQLVVTRCHAKVICLPTRAGDHFTIEGSANLRSSDNLEQMVIFNDSAAHDFHAAWIDELAA